MKSTWIRQRVHHWLRRFQLAPQIEVVVHCGKAFPGSTAEARWTGHNHRHQTRIEVCNGYDEAGTDWRIVHEVFHDAFREMSELQDSIIRQLPEGARGLAGDVLSEAQERLASRVATAITGELPFPELDAESGPDVAVDTHP